MTSKDIFGSYQNKFKISCKKCKRYLTICLSVGLAVYVSYKCVARHASLLISLQDLQRIFSQHAIAIRYESES
jgi:hypothetical protein